MSLIFLLLIPIVANPSTKPESVLLTTSEETIGSYVSPIMFFKSELEASSIILLISSILVSFLISIVKSTVLPSGIGTVIEEEAIFP